MSRIAAAVILFTLTSMTLGSLAQDGVVTKAPTEEAKQAVTERMRSALSEEGLDLEVLVGKQLVLGPRLTAIMLRDHVDVTELAVPSIIYLDAAWPWQRWGFESLGTEMLEYGDGPRTIVAVAALTFTGLENSRKAAAVLESIVGDDQLRVRAPSGQEIGYYYTLVPYEIEEPLVVIETDELKLFCDFLATGDVFYFELLPEDLAVE